MQSLRVRDVRRERHCKTRDGSTVDTKGFRERTASIVTWAGRRDLVLAGNAASSTTAQHQTLRLSLEAIPALLGATQPGQPMVAAPPVTPGLRFDPSIANQPAPLLLLLLLLPGRPLSLTSLSWEPLFTNSRPPPPQVRHSPTTVIPCGPGERCFCCCTLAFSPYSLL